MQQKRYSSFLIPIIFLLILWAIKGYEWQYDISFAHFGIKPKTIEGIRGIFLAPFIHGDFNHLLNNSIPILVLGTSVYFFYREVATKIILWSWFATGLWVWVYARDSFHIGASGVVYGLAFFLFFSGVFRKHYKLMAISLLVVFLYGSMVWGVFPIQHEISWESHLFGAISGSYLAYYYRTIGLQQVKYDWQEEGYVEDDWAEDVEFEEIENEEINPTTVVSATYTSTAQSKINYIYLGSAEKVKM